MKPVDLSLIHGFDSLASRGTLEIRIHMDNNEIKKFIIVGEVNKNSLLNVFKDLIGYLR